jgi:transcriptional regulator with XRE-family HTH domain
MTDELRDLVRLRRLTASGAARKVRLASGLSLNEIANAVGVSPVTVLRWERAQRRPKNGPAALRYGALLDELLEAR